MSAGSGWGVVRDASAGRDTKVKMYRASAQADPAAKSEEKADAWTSSVDVAPDTKLYQLSKQVLALQATIQGTKFVKDDELN